MKETLSMIAGAAALMPDMTEAPKRTQYVPNAFTSKQWRKRKGKLKQQKLSRKINRQRA